MANETRSKLLLKLALVLILAGLCVVAYWRMGLRQGLDLSGGTELLYRIRIDNIPEAKKGNLTQRTIDVIRRRADPRGTEALDIRPRGKFRFYIQIPHKQKGDAERIERRLQRAGSLNFCLGNDKAEDRAKAFGGKPVPRHSIFIKREEKTGPIARTRYHKSTTAELAAQKPGSEDWLLVENKPIVTGKYLAKVYPTVDSMHQNAVGFEFYGKGRSDFANGTGRNIGKKLAIILDNVLYSAPSIRARISGAGVIEGRFTQAELGDLITTLEAGTLPADIELEWKHVVGPGLGMDSIVKGERAIVIGLVLVLIFMAIYYFVAGFVADFALLLNLVLIVGVMSFMRVALTLPGMAGLVLTVGMAVDANVLIYERIREELSRGKGLRLAIRSGYERAFITIIDSNLTTLITALILFGIGTGPVRGFAVTLSVGILASMFTALVVTRLVFELLLDLGWLKNLRMMHFFSNPHVAFSSVRRLCMTLSVILIVVGLVVFNLRGTEKYDSDLTGGIMADIELDSEMPTDQFRGRVAKLYKGGADVQQVMEGATGSSGAKRSRFLIRIKALSEETDVHAAKVTADLARLLEKDGLGDKSSVKRLGLKLTFELSLKKPIDEGVLRAKLIESGYRIGDIRKLVAMDAKAENYIFRLYTQTKEGKDPEANVAEVIKALGDLVVVRDLRVDKIGEMEGETVASDGGRPGRTAWRLDFALQDVCSREAVREALIAQCLGGDRQNAPSVTSSSDSESGARRIRQIRLRGQEATLRKVRRTLLERKSLRVAAFRQQGVSTVRVALRSPQSEETVRARLENAIVDGKPVAGSIVSAVLPQGVEDKRYVLYMGEKLRESKVLEKVREDILAAFKDELASDSYKVKLTPTKKPAKVHRFSRGEGAWFALKLDKPMPLQEVAAKLRQAGASTAFEYMKEDLQKRGRETVTEITVQVPDTPERRDEIVQIFATPDPFQRLESVGKAVAGEMRNKAILAMVVALIAIVFYVWMRFGELKFGIAAIVALTHDVLMTMGAIAVADALSGTLVGRALNFTDIKINVEMIAAFLTIIGYSLNDTIVVFDRIRENLGGARRRKVDAEIVDLSVNQCLSRTLLTSLTTLIVVLTLYVIGGAVIHDFAFALIVGVVVGTYSSIFIASPILVDWDVITGFFGKLFRILTFRFGDPTRATAR